MNSYELLAQKLDSLPNGYPPADDGLHLRVLEKIFTPEEAELTALLQAEPESVDEIAARTGCDAKQLYEQIKPLAQRGLIHIATGQGGPRFSLLPFVVGIFENQIVTMDKELAQLFEDYYEKAFAATMAVEPHYHRIIPVGETIQNSMEIHPYESVINLVDNAKSWGVLECVCRKQKALTGKPCKHPVDLCMSLSTRENAYANNPVVHALTREQALATLKRATEAGLVHSVSNNQQGTTYICNCCTCGCGILRGMATLGYANVIARSAFVNTVDETLCTACGTCLEYCQFGALSIDGYAHVETHKCVGCGVCVPACPSAALILVRRPEAEIKPVPETYSAWGEQRTVNRKK